MSIFGYVKSHKFYNQGVYNLKETSNATGYGLGVSVNKPLNSRLSVFGGYSIALADSLKYGENYTSNAVFHQIDANLSLNIVTNKKIRPYVYTGYAYNHIQQIDLFGMTNSGMNMNAGAGMEYTLSDAFGIGYQLTYAFSLKESIPFNFRHQFGLVYYPSLFVKKERTRVAKTTNMYPVTSLETFDSKHFEAQINKLKQQNDSLRIELQSKVDFSEPQEDKGLIVSYNDELIDKIQNLEKDNQLLLDELRSKRFASDSIYRANYNGYSVIDSSGQVLNVDVKDFPSGYYIIAKDLNNMVDLRRFASNATFSPIETKFLLNRNSKFYVLGFLGSDRDSVMELLSRVTEEKYRYSIVLL